MTLVVSTKKRKENPAMVKTKASRNLLKSVAPLMIASPMEPAGCPGRHRITDKRYTTYFNVRPAIIDKKYRRRAATR
jgi:hypothetical protein